MKSPRRTPVGIRLPVEPKTAARAAALRYVSDESPGFYRRSCGNGFVYIDVRGKSVRDPKVLARIRSLVIPPAWTDVWICRSAVGHLQATGRDARGRKQYRYHPRWRTTRDETKFGRLQLFAAALPRIRAAIRRDLAVPGIPRNKVLAIIVRLMDATGMRVGNEEYARTNGSYGLTTLKNRHVEVRGRNVRFVFRGKSGVSQSVDFSDRRVARIVKRCRDLPGQNLFQYLDEKGRRHRIGSTDVNDYLRRISGEEITAKDFRTWGATVAAAEALPTLEPSSNESGRKRAIAEIVKGVAARLGNTPTVCRKCYIHPLVLDAYGDAAAVASLVKAAAEGGRGLRRFEKAVVALLRSRRSIGRRAA